VTKAIQYRRRISSKAYPTATGVLVFGNSRLKCELIVEAKDHGRNKVWLEEVWELVAKDNEESRITARIEKNMAGLAVHTKPFIRAGKGTIVRSLTLKECEEEIELCIEIHLKPP
jgi:hypothetical protein